MKPTRTLTARAAHDARDPRRRGDAMRFFMNPGSGGLVRTEGGAARRSGAAGTFIRGTAARPARRRARKSAADPCGAAAGTDSRMRSVDTLFPKQDRPGLGPRKQRSGVASIRPRMG